MFSSFATSIANGDDSSVAAPNSSEAAVIVPEDTVRGHIKSLIHDTKREISGAKTMPDELARARTVTMLEKVLFVLEALDPSRPLVVKPPGDKTSSSIGCVTFPFTKTDRAWLKTNAIMQDVRGKDSCILYLPGGQTGKDLGDAAQKAGCSEDLVKAIHHFRGDISGRYGHWLWLWSDSSRTREVVE